MILRAITFAALLFLSAANSPAATLGDLSGSWLGSIDLGPLKLRIGCNFTLSETGGLTGSLVSIDQGCAVIPMSGVALIDDELTLTIGRIGAKFVGEIDEGGRVIEGTWSQGAMNAPLSFKRVDELPGQERPQNPTPPLPYRVEEVRFENPDGGHTLAGTLTLPEGKGPFGAAVLVSGSGPQDRDESLMGHKPFLVLADALTRRGVAVLRYDDRGHGESTGDHAAATSEDFASDALAAVRHLAERSEIRQDAIGICGHSEGGLIGPMVAANHPNEVAFLVLLAPPGVRGDEIIATQAAAMERSMGFSPEDIEAMAAARRKLFALAPEEGRAAAEEILAEVPDSYFARSNDLGAARKAAIDSVEALTTP